MYIDSVKEYFKNKAEDYDLVDEQIYWVLSDKLLWHILKENVLDKIEKPIRFVDAGAGTGRWSKKVLDSYEDSTGTLLDLSLDMLGQARKKITADGQMDRVEIQQVNLDQLDTTDRKEKYNVAFTFHNVLGFVNSPKNVIGKMFDMVEKGGYVVCAVPNYYHDIFFNIFVNNIDLAEECFNTNKGRFTEDMPVMNMFTPESLREIYKENGIDIQAVWGFPVSIYPGMQETQLKGQTLSLEEKLSDKSFFDRVYRMEKELYKREEAASRGNQLIIIGKKL